jgi:integrase
MKLDAKGVARLELPNGRDDIIHFDDQLRGFGFRLRRSASGVVLRSWVAQYRSGSATRRVRIGSDLLLAAEARREAEKILAKVALGEDPQADRQDRRAKDKTTVRATVTEYLAAKRVRPKTMLEMTRYLTNPNYFGSLHRLPIDKVGRKHIASALVTISHERGARTASLARNAIAAFFSWCLQMGLVEVNPVIGTVRFEVKARDRVLNNDELRRIWLGCGDDDFGRIIRLLILTGCRRSEVGGMAWSELDLDKGTWTIPKERAKNGRAHTLPLMPMAREIITAVPQRADRDRVFGRDCSYGFSSWSVAKDLFDDTAGINDFTVHDIRRSVATGMADIGIAPHIIEQILNHVSGHKGGVAGIYNRSNYEREVKQALALWTDHVRSLITGDKRKVVPLREIS